MKNIFVASFFLLISIHLIGQQKEKNFFNQIEGHFNNQLSAYPQEKIHLHIDRNCYVPGEKVWFRAYLADASTHQLVHSSRYVYVELINPRDSLISRIQVRPDQNNVHHGYISIPNDLSEGQYTLCAYTKYMQNQGEDYFFKRDIQIKALLSTQINPVINYRYDADKSRLFMDLSYTNEKGEKIKLEKLRLLDRNGKMQPVNMGRDSIAHLTFKLSEIESMKALYFDADNYKHEVPIAIQDYNYDVSFYPEGGYLLSGTASRIAFKALNAKGHAESITGKLVDGDGKLLQEVKTHAIGMGQFVFTPQSGKRYFLKCNNENNVTKEFELPLSGQSAYSLCADWVANNLYIRVNKSSDIRKTEQLYLLIHCRGKIGYFSAWDHHTNHIVFNRNDFPVGILQVLLLSKGLTPISERLIFSNTKEDVSLLLKTDRDSYSTREKVSTSIFLTDSKGKGLEGEFSVAITDKQDIAIDSTFTILTNLLLSSELKGYIDHSHFYVNQHDQGMRNTLDLLMMTHGWRRYAMPQVLKGEYESPQYKVETSQSISGRVQRLLTSKPLLNANLTLLAYGKPEEGTFVEQTKSNAEGHYVFEGFELPDSTKVIIQSLNARERNTTKLEVDSRIFPFVSSLPWNINFQKSKSIKSEIPESFIEKAEKRAKYDENMRVIQLQEVEVVAPRKVEPKKGEPSIYASPFTMVVDMDDIAKRNPTRLSQVFYGLPGVRVIESDLGEFSLQLTGETGIRGPIYALILVDGLRIDSLSLRTFSPSEIARVEIFKGADATIFGMRGAGGVVNIILKKGGEDNFNNRELFNMKQVNVLGFQRPVEFYAPKYDTPQQKNSYLPDLRATLFWKPDLFTGENGKTSFEFYTSDQANTVYDVVIEGLSKDGRIIREVRQITVE